MQIPLKFQLEPQRENFKTQLFMNAILKYSYET